MFIEKFSASIEELPSDAVGKLTKAISSKKEQKIGGKDVALFEIFFQKIQVEASKAEDLDGINPKTVQDTKVISKLNQKHSYSYLFFTPIGPCIIVGDIILFLFLLIMGILEGVLLLEGTTVNNSDNSNSDKDNREFLIIGEIVGFILFVVLLTKYFWNIWPDLILWGELFGFVFIIIGICLLFMKKFEKIGLDSLIGNVLWFFIWGLALRPTFDYFSRTRFYLDLPFFRMNLYILNFTFWVISLIFLGLYFLIHYIQKKIQTKNNGLALQYEYKNIHNQIITNEKLIRDAISEKNYIYAYELANKTLNIPKDCQYPSLFLKDLEIINELEKKANINRRWQELKKENETRLKTANYREILTECDELQRKSYDHSLIDSELKHNNESIVQEATNQIQKILLNWKEKLKKIIPMIEKCQFEEACKLLETERPKLEKTGVEGEIQHLNTLKNYCQANLPLLRNFNELERVMKQGQVQGMNSLLSKLELNVKNADYRGIEPLHMMITKVQLLRQDYIELIHLIKEEIHAKMTPYGEIIVQKNFQAEKLLLNEAKIQAINANLDSERGELENRIDFVNRLEKLNSLLSMADRIQLNDMGKILGLNREKLLDFIIEYRTQLGAKLDGDTLILFTAEKNMSNGDFLLETQNISGNDAKSGTTFTVNPKQDSILIPKDAVSIDHDGKCYKILSNIARGGMGEIFLVIESHTGQLFALKHFFSHAYETDVDCDEYWQREQEILKIQSKSPVHVLHFQDAFKKKFDSVKSDYYILMDFIQGITLEEWIKQHPGRPSDTEISQRMDRIILPLCRHLQFIHSQGIIHRDITPRNIMILTEKYQSIPVLIDWGVAKLQSASHIARPQSSTAATTIASIGNPPEVLAGLDPVIASDIYMLGNIMYYLFSGGTLVRPLRESEYILNLTKENNNAPPELVQLIKAMTQFESNARIQPLSKIIEIIESKIL